MLTPRLLPHALSAALAATPALAGERAINRSPEVQVASADCYAIGQRVAAEQGGQLARASARNQNGQTVCVIVVLVPDPDGGRDRRMEFVVPAG